MVFMVEDAHTLVVYWLPWSLWCTMSTGFLVVTAMQGGMDHADPM
jgi:hypothetical protein